jgi:hypothetical protein
MTAKLKMPGLKVLFEEFLAAIERNRRPSPTVP